MIDDAAEGVWVLAAMIGTVGGCAMITVAVLGLL